MADDYFNWDDLDLDYLFGEGNYTDDDLGSEKEWFGSDGTDESDNNEIVSPPVSQAPTPPSTPNTNHKNKENVGENLSKSVPKKHFKCPVCSKMYSSISGFRGHVVKKHERPDIKAHQHQVKHSEEEVQLHLQHRSLPLSSSEDFEKEFPGIANSALRNLQEDQFLASSNSNSGSLIVKISSLLLTIQLSLLYSFLAGYFSSVFTDGVETKFAWINKAHELRVNKDFLRDFSSRISEYTCSSFEVPANILNRFIQQFLTKFTAAFFRRQADLIENQQKFDIELVSNNDKQVIYYICGYLVHALKKRYYKIKNQSKREQLISALESLLTKEDLPNSDWLKLMNRGGLKTPTEEFFKIIVQVERWLREWVNKDNLNQDSLVLLHLNLMESQLLKTCWNKLMANCDCNFILLEHILSLFLKVRGFALVKLIRKDLAKKRKNSKAAAGSRKALRRELKEMNKTR